MRDHTLKFIIHYHFQISMDELRKAHFDSGHATKPKYEPSGLTDKRLPLYGYSTETIHLLLLPMINNKYVS